MNLKVYEKTRYQNIYRHKKNKNYLVMISKPVKSSISSIDGDKIWKIEDAIRIRENPKIRMQKDMEIKHKDLFDELLDKYVEYCERDLKLSFNTIKKKKILFNLYFKNKFQRISKVTKSDMISLLDKADCSDKQKNELIKIINPFFNWCLEEEIIFKNPMFGIKLYKVNKSEMKYWLPEHLTKILEALNFDIKNADLKQKYFAYIIKMLIVIGFSLGDRVGETRALRFSKVSKQYNTIEISNSINYNTKDESYLSHTKTKESEDVLFVTSKLVDEIFQFKDFLENELNYSVDDNTPILVNIKTNRPFSDTKLRDCFNYYIDKSGVPKIRMYDLRHTLATTLMSEGYDMYDIKDRLRHSSIRTTIDSYGHITQARKKEVASITDKYF